MGRDRKRKHDSGFRSQPRPPEPSTPSSKSKKENNQKRPNRNGDKNKTGDQGGPSQENSVPPQNIPSVSTPFEPWVKPDHLSDRWNILQSKTSTDLTIMSWNVNGIGTKVKRQSIHSIADDLGADIIALIEHKKPHNKFVKEKDWDTPVLNCKALHLPGYNSASMHRGKGQGGGISLHWKGGMNIQPWAGAEMPQLLKVASRERLWVKIQCGQTPIMLAVVYMPCENSGVEKAALFDNILEVLSLDMQELKKQGLPSVIVGDFNSHIGNNDGNSLGIPNNNSRIGENGSKLLQWLQSWDKLIVNAQNCATGLYTRQKGISHSILDLMIIDDQMLPLMKGLVIDDMGEYRLIKTDHNPLVGLIKGSYNRLNWAPPKTKTWSVPKTNKNLFQETMENCMEASNATFATFLTSSSVDTISSGVEKALLTALGKASKKVSHTSGTKEIPTAVLEYNKKIRRLNSELYRLHRRLHIRNSMEVTQKKIASLEEEINKTIEERAQLEFELSREKDKKSHRILRKKGPNCKRFWNEIKPNDATRINSLKKEDGSQTSTPEETIKRAQDYFQNLFTKKDNNNRRNASNPTNPKITLGNSQRLTKTIKKQTVLTYLKKLKKGKAAGPDGIKNEFLTMAKDSLAPVLTKLFNLCLKTGLTPATWGEGLMHILFKKGDRSDLSDYRGLTVNNTISKLFTTILNDRLSKLAEHVRILGQIQNGGRKNMRATDALFVLRTVLDKASFTNKDFSLCFIDFTKAYDTIPHDLLWEKLKSINVHPQFIKVLMSLYKDNTIKVIINGHKTEEVRLERGIKQGCVLSPLLFLLYISDLASMIENDKGGIQINDVIVSGLLYMDDLILIGRNKNELIGLLGNTQLMLEDLDMSVNCPKSNILYSSDISISNENEHDYFSPLKAPRLHMELHDSEGNEIGIIKYAELYKYLGIQVSLGRAATIFAKHRQTITSRLDSFAGLILGLAKETTAPELASLQLWESCALQSVLHGSEVVSINQAEIKDMESTQAQFGASIMGVRHSTSSSGILMELGLPKISYRIHLRKLKFWRRLITLPEENWARQAFLECHKGTARDKPRLCLLPNIPAPAKPTWSSSYVRDMNKIINLYNLQSLPNLTGVDGKDLWESITKALRDHEEKTIVNDIVGKQDHSLRCLPEYPRNLKCQEYLIYGGPHRKTLAKFRLGNAGLGNRDTPSVKVCPACNSGPNIESHLVFGCSAMDHLKNTMNESVQMDKFLRVHSKVTNPGHLLKLFLGDDWSGNEVLQKRGEYIDILLAKHKEFLDGLHPH